MARRFNLSVEMKLPNGEWFTYNGNDVVTTACPSLWSFIGHKKQRVLDARNVKEARDDRSV